MNAVLQVVLTLALVTGGIAAYHVLVDEGAGTAAGEVHSVGDRDLAALEARVEILENRAPLLRGSADGSEVLLDLEARVRTLESAGPAARRTAGSTEAAPGPAVDAATDDTVPVAAGDAETSLTDAQEKAVRRLVDGAVRERMQGRFEGRMNRTLERLGIELTSEQREKLSTAWSAHMESVREVVHAGRESGLTREELTGSLATLNQKLTESVSTFLPAGDAEAITGALSANMRGPGGGPGGGGGRGR